MPGEKRVFVSHVTSGASMVICVQRSNGVRKLLELAGPLNPRHGGTSTGRFSLREEFGIDEFSNAIHGVLLACLIICLHDVFRIFSALVYFLKGHV